VPLDVRTASRLLVVTVPDEPTRLFRLPLARDPRPTATVGAWRRADQVDRLDTDGPTPAPSDDPLELRYRVRPPQ